jgi:hypothetical protein
MPAAQQMRVRIYTEGDMGCSIEGNADKAKASLEAKSGASTELSTHISRIGKTAAEKITPDADAEKLIRPCGVASVKAPQQASHRGAAWKAEVTRLYVRSSPPFADHQILSVCSSHTATNPFCKRAQAQAQGQRQTSCLHRRVHCRSRR